MPKVILSRKGFDSGSGGKANVLLEDQLISFPIPQKGTGISYDQLRISQDFTYRHLMDELGIAPFEEAHLDPDLLSSVLPGRPEDWLPAFGQQGAALSHLNGEQVGVGDVFLFFGWFRQIEKNHTGKYRYCKNSPDLHIIYGYLEVGEVIDLSKHEAPKLGYISSSLGLTSSNETLGTPYSLQQKDLPFGQIKREQVSFPFRMNSF